MPHAHDVIVVGAGPAGAVCATELARHGWHVLVLERARQPRFKTCGGGLVGRSDGFVSWQRVADLRPSFASAETGGCNAVVVIE